MHRLLVVVILVIVVIGFPILASSDTAILTSDADIPNSDVASNISKVGDSSASATITITMYTGDE